MGYGKYNEDNKDLWTERNASFYSPYADAYFNPPDTSCKVSSFAKKDSGKQFKYPLRY